MNRQGKYFTLLVMLFYIFASIWALFIIEGQFIDRAPLHGKAIGDRQGALLLAYERADRKAFYARDAAREASAQARAQLAASPRAFFTSHEGETTTPPSCGAYGYQSFDCIKDKLVRTTFTQVVDKALAARLGRYPGGFGTQYQVVQDAGELDFNAILREPLLLNLAPTAESGAVARHLNGQDVVGTLTWPMRGAQDYITSCYGPRPGVRGASSGFHHGIDIRATGQVIAAADGVTIPHSQKRARSFSRARTSSPHTFTSTRALSPSIKGTR